MMLPTHALVGLALAVPLAWVAPELAPAALLGGLVGGVLPDLDLYAGHRRTLHYPTVYPLLSVPAVGLAVLRPSTAAVALAFVLVAAAVHCRMDRYGGGLELRPWEGTSERAVYDHVHGEWLAPRRLVSYDGSPGDLALATGVATLPVVLLEGPVVHLTVGLLAVGAAYTVLRRRLADLAPRVFGRVPGRFASLVPDRYGAG